VTAKELEKRLSKLTRTINSHSMFLTVLVTVFLENQPGQKQGMIDALKRMKEFPEFADTSHQEAIDLALRALQNATPTIH
jgi:hypothetical protein